MKNLPRGISPELLLSQVKNTMPYLFDASVVQTKLGSFVPAKVLREYDQEVGKPLTHFEYFRVCLSSHYSTCATPVPTDVDNQIRLKLWPAQLPAEVAIQMAQLVLESRHWEFSLVSERFHCGAKDGPWGNRIVGGHQGEWFTVACAAYCALKSNRDPLAQRVRQDLFDSIADEVNSHSEVFGSHWRANDGLTCLKISANLAHNFGDLDRVMDMWDLDMGDPLRLEYYKLTAAPFNSEKKLRYLGRLWVAGELYKSLIHGSSMAFENHRHFALRKPKCLRLSPNYLVPNGPFFDDWGRRVAHGLSQSNGGLSDSLMEVIEALQYGWSRLPKTVGYGRALRGIQEVFPDLRMNGLNQVPKYESVFQETQENFEKKWSDEALKLMEDIPSRA